MKLGEGRRRQDRDTTPNQTKPNQSRGCSVTRSTSGFPALPRNSRSFSAPNSAPPPPILEAFVSPVLCLSPVRGALGTPGCGWDMPGHTRGMSRQLPSSCKGALNTPLGSWVDLCGCELDFHTASTFWSPRDHGGPSEPPLTQQPPSAPLSFLRAPFPRGKQPVCPAASVPSALDYLGK